MINKGFEDVLISFGGDVEELGNIKVPTIEAIEEWKGFNKRRIYLNFEIGSFIAQFSKYIIRWNEEDKDIDVKDRTPIKIYINSPGGNLQDCLTFIDILKMSKTPIVLICISGAYSAAGYIFMCKSEHITRLIVPHGKVLIHQGSIGMGQTQTNQFLATAETVKKEEEIVQRYVLANTTITEKLYNKKKKDEWMLNAEQCLKLGVCDKIVEDIEEIF